MKWLDFFGGINTIIVKNETEFNKFYDFMNDLGLQDFFHGVKDFSEWQHLSKINKYPSDYIIFEYQPCKGMTFGYTIEQSKEWYEEEPLPVNVVDSFYNKSKLFNQNKNLNHDMDLEIEK